MNDRPPPTPDQIAWLEGYPTRWELVKLVQIVQAATITQMELCVAIATGDQSSVPTIAAEASATNDRIAVIARELLNAGADPEWDHRA
ncbi:MAG: hypothetical protein ACTHM0_13460 [Sphingomonas sp.]